jgi:hypothetical protein
MHKKIIHHAKKHFHRAMTADLKSNRLKKIFFRGFLAFCLIFTGLIFWASWKLGNEEYVQPTRILTARQRKMVNFTNGSPMEKMQPYILEKNPEVATYLVAIAKKESNWGMYSPKKEGKECFNYWGYMGTYNQTNSGYSCFDSPDQAVDVVGKRLQELIDQGINTPREMVVWKCGSDCSVFSASSVADWISDVGYYYHEITKKNKKEAVSAK